MVENRTSKDIKPPERVRLHPTSAFWHDTPERRMLEKQHQEVLISAINELFEQGKIKKEDLHDFLEQINRNSKHYRIE